jgi:hypothetical protein
MFVDTHASLAYYLHFYVGVWRVAARSPNVAAPTAVITNKRLVCPQRV